MFYSTLQSTYTVPPDSISLIRRPKLSGFGSHYGVLIEYPHSDHAVVYDITAKAGLRKMSASSFLSGKQGEVLEVITDRVGILIAIARLNRVWSIPNLHAYDLFGGNCEHLARYIVTGKNQSLQIQIVGFLASLLVLGFLLKRENI